MKNSRKIKDYLEYVDSELITIKKFDEIVVSAMFGVSDLAPAVISQECSAEIIFFTDNKDLKSDFATIIFLDGLCSDARENAKWFKLFCPFLFPWAKAVWIDANVKHWLVDLDLIFKELQNNSLVLHRHPSRSNVKSEYLYLWLTGRERLNTLNRIISHRLFKENLYYGNVIGFKFSKNLTKGVLFWWYCIKTISMRDQLSLPTVANIVGDYKVISHTSSPDLWVAPHSNYMFNQGLLARFRMRIFKGAIRLIR